MQQLKIITMSKKKHLIFLLATAFLFASTPVLSYADGESDSEDETIVSDPQIIRENSSGSGDNRDYTFPFHFEYDSQMNTVIVDYSQDREATIALTDSRGRTISQQTLYSSGAYYVTLPSSGGLYYLFMMTPTLYAYVSITL